MTPPKPAPNARGRSVSPAERGAEFAARQQQLKEEAAERRRLAEAEPDKRNKPRPTASSRG